MGCGMSMSNKRKGEWIIQNSKERRRLVKLAVEERYAFANAHSSYFHSLSSLSCALPRLFQPDAQTRESQYWNCIVENVDDKDNDNHNWDEDENENDNHKWDFFNLLDLKEANPIPIPTSSSSTTTTTTTTATTTTTTKTESIVKHKNRGNDSLYLWEAFKEVGLHFGKLHESGVLLSSFFELVDSPLLPLVEANFSNKCSVSAFKTLISSNSNSDSNSNSSRNTWLESSSNCNSTRWLESSSNCNSTSSSSIGDNKSLVSSNHSCWGTISASATHSFTLGRLCAWENKLYDELKTGDRIWQIYKQKCSQFHKDDLELCRPSTVIHLYHQILVSVQRSESISIQIEKLRDEELQPQLIQLLHSLMETWKAMLKTHEIQKIIMHDVSCPLDLCNFSNRLAILQLESVIQNWYTCFSQYLSAQKSYVSCLDGWLSKFVDAEVEYYYKGSSSLPPIRFNGPTLMVICQSWLTCLERLPEKAVKDAMRRLAKDIQALWDQQGKERQQKQKVDGLTKEMDKMILAKAKHIAYGGNVKDENEKERQLDLFRKRIEMEKERCNSSLQETKQSAIRGLQMGFASLFESLADFSRASVKIYADLLTFPHTAQV